MPSDPADPQAGSEERLVERFRYWVGPLGRLQGVIYDMLRDIVGQETAPLLARIAELEQEISRQRQFVSDVVEDMECLPGCDSYGHEELCPLTNPREAWRTLRKERDEARTIISAAEYCIRLHGACDCDQAGRVREALKAAE